MPGNKSIKNVMFRIKPGWLKEFSLREGIWSEMWIGIEQKVRIFVVLLLAHRKKNVLTFWHQHFDEGLIYMTLSYCLYTLFRFSGNETDLNSKIWEANRKECQGEREMPLWTVGGPEETCCCCCCWWVLLLSAF